MNLFAPLRTLFALTLKVHCARRRYLPLDARYWGDPIMTPQALLNGGKAMMFEGGKGSGKT